MKKIFFGLIFILVASNIILSQIGNKARIGGKVNSGRAIATINGFTAKKTVTVDHTKVSNSNQTDFPMLFSGTFTYLKTTGNGGSVTDAQGDDVVFTSDSGCATNLKFEQETYSATTGAVVYWVKIPTLSTSVDTSIFLCYGKSSITTFQGDAVNVWTSSYEGVWHLRDGSTLSPKNSVTGVDGTITGATANTGNIDGGALFGGASTDKIVTDIGTNNTTRTYSIWANLNGAGGGAAGRMAAKGTTTATEYLSYVDGTGSYDYSKFWSTSGSSWRILAPATGAYHYFTITYDNSSSSNDPIMYLDGISQTVTENSPPVGSPNNNSEAWVIGNRGTDNARNWSGSLDEFRIANVIRSVDWILTEYNNQSSPSTFYTVS